MANVFWFTGLPCSGKTTVAKALQKEIPGSAVLDGDEVRNGVCSDLGFEDADRIENVRRVAHTAQLLVHQNIDVIVSLITPLHAHRTIAWNILNPQLHLIFLDAPLEICEERDVKGMYKAARKGNIFNFTGITGNYEKPTQAEYDLRFDTSISTVNEIITGIKKLYC